MAAEPHLINCVCTGNICRSPMAERLLKHALEGQTGAWACRYTVVSSGIFAAEGQRATSHSVQALKKVGIDLDDHRSQAVTQSIVQQSALTLCMTDEHKDFIQRLFPNVTTPILLIRALLTDAECATIGDPYGHDFSHYEACRDSIAEAIPSILSYLKTL